LVRTISTGSRDLLSIGVQGVAEVKDGISLPPDVSGPRGKAWLADTAAAQRALGVKPEDDACLAQWVIEAPWAHPIWHSYALTLVHLRPMGDGRKTLFYIDGATHEVWLYALTPEEKREPVLRNGKVPSLWMTPSNFAAQFIEITDQLAFDRAKNAVQMVCDGKLNPDSDFRKQWEALFGNNMMKDRPGYRPPVRR